MNRSPKKPVQRRGSTVILGKGWHFDSPGHKKAGGVGGQAVVEKYGKEHMAEIGRKGGKNRWKNRQSE